MLLCYIYMYIYIYIVSELLDIVRKSLFEFGFDKIS